MKKVVCTVLFGMAVLFIGGCDGGFFKSIFAATSSTTSPTPVSSEKLPIIVGRLNSLEFYNGYKLVYRASATPSYDMVQNFEDDNVTLLAGMEYNVGDIGMGVLDDSSLEYEDGTLVPVLQKGWVLPWILYAFGAKRSDLHGKMRVVSSAGVRMKMSSIERFASTRAMGTDVFELLNTIYVGTIEPPAGYEFQPGGKHQRMLDFSLMNFGTTTAKFFTFSPFFTGKVDEGKIERLELEDRKTSEFFESSTVTQNTSTFTKKDGVSIEPGESRYFRMYVSLASDIGGESLGYMFLSSSFDFHQTAEIYPSFKGWSQENVPIKTDIGFALSSLF